MKLFKAGVKKLIETKDEAGLKELLSKNPDLANEGITIPFDLLCRSKAHPLHRLCDAVFAAKLSDTEAIALAKVFLENGALIDGDKLKNEGSPLLAAASLHAEQLGIFYINQGADVHYALANDGASALHWAAYCGRDQLVHRLISAGAALDEPDIKYKSTPLGWAIQALRTNDRQNKHNQLACIALLLKSGASIEKLDEEKNKFLLSLSQEDPEL